MRIMDWISDVCSSDLVGIATDIIANGKSQITGHQRRAETDGKTALLAVTHIFGRGQEIVDIGDDSLCDCQKSFAVLGCKSPTLGTNEQFYADHFFARLHTPNDRCFLSFANFCNTRKATRIGRHHGGPEMADFNRQLLHSTFLQSRSFRESPWFLILRSRQKRPLDRASDRWQDKINHERY